MRLYKIIHTFNRNIQDGIYKYLRPSTHYNKLKNRHFIRYSFYQWRFLNLYREIFCNNEHNAKYWAKYEEFEISWYNYRKWLLK